jgi:hypothetical protein
LFESRAAPSGLGVYVLKTPGSARGYYCGCPSGLRFSKKKQIAHSLETFGGSSKPTDYKT